MQRLLALTLACATNVCAQTGAIVPYSWQHASITKVSGSAPNYTLTVDYVDLFDLNSIDDFQKARKMGIVKNVDQYRKLADQAPNGLYIRNINPKLRTVTTDKNTKYQLVCLNKPGGSMLVNAQTFMKALKGSSPCWPMDSTVQLMLQGTRVVQINQVYFP